MWDNVIRGGIVFIISMSCTCLWRWMFCAFIGSLVNKNNRLGKSERSAMYDSQNQRKYVDEMSKDMEML